MIETTRLKMRPFVPEDLKTVIALRSDPEVAKYVGGAEFDTVTRFGFYLAHQRQHGFAMGAVHLKATNEVIGWAGLQHLDGTPEIEVGYAFAQAHWRKGYATETAAAWLRYGFEQLGLPRIVAVVIPENRASRHVLEKLGMSYEGLKIVRGTECAYYTLTKEQFQNGINPIA